MFYLSGPLHSCQELESEGKTGRGEGGCRQGCWSERQNDGELRREQSEQNRVTASKIQEDKDTSREGDKEKESRRAAALIMDFSWIFMFP